MRCVGACGNVDTFLFRQMPRDTLGTKAAEISWQKRAMYASASGAGRFSVIAAGSMMLVAAVLSGRIPRRL
jgi:hypothetical protein